jgi:hypothetical protein
MYILTQITRRNDPSCITKKRRHPHVQLHPGVCVANRLIHGGTHHLEGCLRAGCGHRGRPEQAPPRCMQVRTPSIDCGGDWIGGRTRNRLRGFGRQREGGLTGFFSEKSVDVDEVVWWKIRWWGKRSVGGRSEQRSRIPSVSKECTFNFVRKNYVWPYLYNNKPIFMPSN